jgi:hypothetical protein
MALITSADTIRSGTDRRKGQDRRTSPRRQELHPVTSERRRRVDRRRGPERRSTLDRRIRARDHSTESPGEHLRNALQILALFPGHQELDERDRSDLMAAIARVRQALRLLEHQAPSGWP